MSREEGQMLMTTAGGLIFDLVTKRGGFLPFAVALTSSGELRIVQVEYTEHEGEPIEQLQAVLRREAAAGRYNAVAVAEDIEIMEPQTGQQIRAARVEIDHHSMPPVTWYWPFEQSGNGWEFGGASGEGYLQEGEGRFFRVEQ